jgi:ApbE superfamily uncharacterized protein (UPF0280 family)
VQSRDYRFRYYRNWMRGRNLSRIRLVRGESDVLVLSDSCYRSEADMLLREARSDIQAAVSSIPGFRESLEPLTWLGKVSPVVDAMLEASRDWGVGPMASVAGAIAHHVAQGLRHPGKTVLVENGGDTFSVSPVPVTFQVYAGEASPFPRDIGFMVDAGEGVSVCTSSGMVGPSWSAGLADAVVTVAEGGASADAAATSIANLIGGESDVGPVMESMAGRNGLRGLIVMAGSCIGVWGDLELVTTLRGA